MDHHSNLPHKGKKINMDIIQCYALTNNSDDQDKEEFYSRLLTVIQDRPERNEGRGYLINKWPSFR